MKCYVLYFISVTGIIKTLHVWITQTLLDKQTRFVVNIESYNIIYYYYSDDVIIILLKFAHLHITSWWNSSCNTDNTRTELHEQLWHQYELKNWRNDIYITYIHWKRWVKCIILYTCIIRRCICHKVFVAAMTVMWSMPQSQLALLEWNSTPSIALAVGLLRFPHAGYRYSYQ